MPVDVTINIPKAGQPAKFKRYTPIEIRNAWKAIGHFTLGYLSEDNKFILFFTDEVMDALTVSALFIRELGTSPESTCYDFNNKVLLLYYGSVSLGNANLARAITTDLIERIMSHREIREISHDVWGERLFWPSIGG